MDKKALETWELLGHIPVNEEDEIEEEFLGFPKGYCKFEIWHWIEDKFNVRVYDLMKHEG